MNDNLTSKQSIVLTLLEAVAKKNPNLISADQITHISIASGMTKKAVDSQLRVLATKDVVTKVGPRWRIVVHAQPAVVAEYTVDDPSVRHDVVKADKAITQKINTGERREHKECAHASTKADRAKCRRLRAKNA